jgi:stearoyl-CoA desaturase (delta-9 desaturase)
MLNASPPLDYSHDTDNHYGSGTDAADTQQQAEKISPLARFATLCIIILPFAGFIGAIVYLWGWGVSWVELSLMLSMYVLTVLGITVGFHRLFTHKAFETSRFMQCALAILGSMAVQGSLIQWVALHRRHHQYSDMPNDVHSPHHHEEGILGMLRGAWHSHIGWFFVPNPPEIQRYVKDILRSKLLRTVSALFPLWVAIGLLIPTVLGGVLTHSWSGALLGLLWGGLGRVFLVHHVTWSINSVCHLWGGRPYKTKDQSRNNLLFGILGLGEGWHNNHHAFPVSARHGLKWWQIDVSYWVIRTMAFLKLAWNIKLPTQRAA